MQAKSSQRTAVFIGVGIVALVYVSNLAIFTLTAEAQLAAGGLLMVALGILWIYLMGGLETFTCDRQTCRLVKPRFLWHARGVDQIAFNSIEEARVEEVYLMSLDGPGRTGYQAVLKLKDRTSHFFAAVDSEQSAQAVADRVNTFLKTATHESLVVRRVPWLMIGIGASAIGIGGLLILSALSTWLAK